MSCVLVIGAGGVGSVVVQKMRQRRDVFESIVLASRTLEKCRKIQQRAPDIEIPGSGPEKMIVGSFMKQAFSQSELETGEC
jgi:saccharopine dehydrogenase-like NADP-dependent oxidoreductase